MKDTRRDTEILLNNSPKTIGTNLIPEGDITIII
jgi:hypothetical protein